MNVLLSNPESLQVWIDFDGTISRKDVLDELIRNFAINESWRLIEERWLAGLIGSRECLSQEFSLINISREQLNSFLDQIELDPGIGPLLALLRQHGVPTAVLSDGIERFIRRILLRHGITKLEIRANKVSHRAGRMTLSCPHASRECVSNAAHCKCASADALRHPARRTVYIGDGRSDLCPARSADFVFAKGILANTLAHEHIPFIPYVTLHDVTAVLSRAWSAKVEAV